MRSKKATVRSRKRGESRKTREAKLEETSIEEIEDLGKLLGVSAQSIYNWEAEKARPRAEQIAKLAVLRGLGKRGIAAQLTQLVGGMR